MSGGLAGRAGPPWAVVRTPASTATPTNNRGPAILVSFCICLLLHEIGRRSRGDYRALSTNLKARSCRGGQSHHRLSPLPSFVGFTAAGPHLRRSGIVAGKRSRPWVPTLSAYAPKGILPGKSRRWFFQETS